MVKPFLLMVPIWLTLLSFFITDQNDPAFIFETPDQIVTEVFEKYDAADKLIGYSSRVNSPICDKTECYDVKLDFHWDIIGKFQHYQIVPEHPLTKREHEAFTKSDYIKLEQVLKMPSPAFASMEKEEMIENLVSDGLDGMTGATIAAIKEDIVPGAAYSCYTLWHIANGPVVDSIEAHTHKKFDQSTFEQLSERTDEKALFFLIDHAPASILEKNISSVVALIQTRGGFFARHAIEKMPNQIFESEGSQRMLIEQCQALDYFTKLALVKKFQTQRVGTSGVLLLTKELSSRNTALDLAIMSIITDDRQNYSIESKEDILQKLQDMQYVVPTRFMPLLESWSTGSRKLKKQIKQLHRRVRGT